MSKGFNLGRRHGEPPPYRLAGKPSHPLPLGTERGGAPVPCEAGVGAWNQENIFIESDFPFRREASISESFLAALAVVDLPESFVSSAPGSPLLCVRVCTFCLFVSARICPVASLVSGGGAGRKRKV